MNPVRNPKKYMGNGHTQRESYYSSISNGMKNILLLSVVALFGFASHAFAQGFVPLAEIPGLTSGVTANSEGLAQFFNNLYRYLIGLAAVLAIIEIIWGGLEMATKDSISKQSEGKERIQEAILGLVLVLSPVLVFSIINPSILNLSVNLSPLDTKSGIQLPTPVPQVVAGVNGNNTERILYLCSSAGGSNDCSQAITDCKKDGGFTGQSYCVDSSGNSSATNFIGGGCDAGLRLGIKCSK